MRNNAGFIFGGDSNCMMKVWARVFAENQFWQGDFGTAEFVYADRVILRREDTAKSGDIGMVMGIDNLHAKQCDVRFQSRENSRD